jgi:hypothetical protein
MARPVESRARSSFLRHDDPLMIAVYRRQSRLSIRHPEPVDHAVGMWRHAQARSECAGLLSSTPKWRLKLLGILVHKSSAEYGGSSGHEARETACPASGSLACSFLEGAPKARQPAPQLVAVTASVIRSTRSGEIFISRATVSCSAIIRLRCSARSSAGTDVSLTRRVASCFSASS